MFDNPEKPDSHMRAPRHNARAFQQVLHEAFGVPFALFDAATGAEVAGTGSAHDGALRRELDAPTVKQLAGAGQAVVVPWEGKAFCISLVLQAAGGPALVAAGIVPALAETAGARAVEQARLQSWARDFSERRCATGCASSSRPCRC
jgi:hypothetical protein